MKTPTLKISELAKKLTDLQKDHGDVEVFVTNERDACFDGVGTVVTILGASDGERVVILVRNDQVIKPKL